MMGVSKYKIGRQFGRLTIIKRDHERGINEV